jgi:hypothetical protein
MDKWSKLRQWEVRFDSLVIASVSAQEMRDSLDEPTQDTDEGLLDKIQVVMDTQEISDRIVLLQLDIMKRAK